MKLDDFLTTPVPHEHRIRGLNILVAWMGFILVVASMSFGGGLASEMNLHDLTIAILGGSAFLALCAAVTGYIGSKSGLTFGSLAARVFPKGTWRLAILYVPLSLIGWYAIESSIFGNFVASIFHLNDLVRHALMALAAIFFSVSAYIGVRFIGKASYVLIPAVVLISLFALFHVQTNQLSFNFGTTHISLGAGLAIVMSTWIFSALLVVPDLTRFVRNPLLAALFGAIGVFVGNVAALSIGAFAAAYTHQSDPSLILVGLGFTPLALLLSFASIWSTNDNNMYSSSLNVARVLSLTRRNVVLALAIVGAIIALFNPSTISGMFAFLAFMGASAPPLGAIVIGSYLYRKGKEDVLPTVAAPWLAWIVASFITFQLQGPIIIPAGLVLGFVLWLVFDYGERFVGKKRTVVSI